MEQYKCKI